MTLTRHYTGHFKAVVTKPQNVLVMRDVACAGYIAGGNTRFFSKNEVGTGHSFDWATRNLMSRLSFDDDVTDRYASMLAFPAHEDQFNSGQLDTVMSVTSRLLPWEVSNTSTHDSFPGGHEMYMKYASKLQLQQVHYGEDMKAAENQDFISQVSGGMGVSQMRHSSDHATFPFANLHLAVFVGIHEQRHLLPGPAPQVRPLHQDVHVAHAGPGPLRPRRHPRRRALAPWRVGVAQDRARLHDEPRARAARPDGLLSPLNWRWRPLTTKPYRRERRICVGTERVSVCVCACVRV